MAYSYVSYTASAADYTYDIPFDYLDATHLTVTIDTVATANYTITTGSPNFITIDSVLHPLIGGEIIEIRRTTPRLKDERLVVFTQPSVIRSDDLNTQGLQNLYVAQEAFDDAEDANDLAVAQAAAVTLAQATAENALALAQSAALTADINTRGTAVVTTSMPYATDASEVAFRSIISNKSWDRSYPGWQLSENDYIVENYRCLGSIKIPRYSARYGGIIRTEIFGEVLNEAIPGAGGNALVCRLGYIVEPGIDDIMATHTVFNSPLAAGQHPFHITVDMIPCGRYRTMLRFVGRVGSDGTGGDSYQMISAMQGGAGDYSEGNLDSSYHIGRVSADPAETNFIQGDVFSIKDGNSASPVRTIAFMNSLSGSEVFEQDGASGEDFDVLIGATKEDTLDNLETALARSPFKLWTYRVTTEAVLIYAPYGGLNHYGQSTMAITLVNKETNSAMLLTDFSSGADDSRFDWSTDQEFFLHARAVGNQSWVYHIESYQIGGTKGWSHPLR